MLLTQGPEVNPRTHAKMIAHACDPRAKKGGVWVGRISGLSGQPANQLIGESWVKERVSETQDCFLVFPCTCTHTHSHTGTNTPICPHAYIKKCKTKNPKR